MCRLPASLTSLRTCEGELLHLSVTVALRQIESLLDTLGGLPFPVNPEIIHSGLKTDGRTGTVLVRFPAYGRRLAVVLGSLERAGLPSASVEVQSAH